jgi:acyl-CoA synthetase (AMP-forming)/AMP-acid ligase II
VSAPQTFAIILSPVPGIFGGRVDPVKGMTGILCPNLEARILREDGSDADYDEMGELVVRGPTSALGYWNNESASKETFKDGWLYTGDRFYVDREDRFLYVLFSFSNFCRKIEIRCPLKLRGTDKGRQQVALVMICSLILVRNYL